MSTPRLACLCVTERVHEADDENSSSDEDMEDSGAPLPVVQGRTLPTRIPSGETLTSDVETSLGSANDPEANELAERRVRHRQVRRRVVTPIGPSPEVASPRVSADGTVGSEAEEFPASEGGRAQSGLDAPGEFLLCQRQASVARPDVRARGNPLARAGAAGLRDRAGCRPIAFHANPFIMLITCIVAGHSGEDDPVKRTRDEAALSGSSPEGKGKSVRPEPKRAKVFQRDVVLTGDEREASGKGPFMTLPLSFDLPNRADHMVASSLGGQSSAGASAAGPSRSNRLQGSTRRRRHGRKVRSTEADEDEGLY